MSIVSALEAELNAANGHAIAAILAVEREHQERRACACTLCQAAARYRRALRAWGAATDGDGNDPERRPRREKARP